MLTPLIIYLSHVMHSPEAKAPWLPHLRTRRGRLHRCQLGLAKLAE